MEQVRIDSDTGCEVKLKAELRARGKEYLGALPWEGGKFEAKHWGSSHK